MKILKFEAPRHARRPREGQGRARRPRPSSSRPARSAAACSGAGIEVTAAIDEDEPERGPGADRSAEAYGPRQRSGGLADADVERMMPRCAASCARCARWCAPLADGRTDDELRHELAALRQAVAGLTGAGDTAAGRGGSRGPRLAAAVAPPRRRPGRPHRRRQDHHHRQARGARRADRRAPGRHRDARQLPRRRRRADAHVRRPDRRAARGGRPSRSRLAGAVDADRDAQRIYIDTAGRSPRDRAALADLERALAPVADVEVHLVVPAGSPAAAIDACFDRHRPLPIDRLLFTKVDEADELRELVRAPARLGLPGHLADHRPARARGPRGRQPGSACSPWPAAASPSRGGERDGSDQAATLRVIPAAPRPRRSRRAAAAWRSPAARAASARAPSRSTSPSPVGPARRPHPGGRHRPRHGRPQPAARRRAGRAACSTRSAARRSTRCWSGGARHPPAAGAQRQLRPGQPRGRRRATSCSAASTTLARALRHRSCVDVAAGIGDSARPCAGAAADVVVVVNPEPLSMADAYACLKVLATASRCARLPRAQRRAQSRAQADEVVGPPRRAGRPLPRHRADAAAGDPVDSRRRGGRPRRAAGALRPRLARRRAIRQVARALARWRPAGALVPRPRAKEKCSMKAYAAQQRKHRRARRAPDRRARRDRAPHLAADRPPGARTGSRARTSSPPRMLGLTEAAERYDAQPRRAVPRRSPRSGSAAPCSTSCAAATSCRAARARWPARSARRSASSSSELGRPPEDEEVAAALGVSVDEYRERPRAPGARHRGRARRRREYATGRRRAAPTAEPERPRAGAACCAALPSSSRSATSLVLSLYYVEELTYAEIGRSSGVTTLARVPAPRPRVARLRAAQRARRWRRTA